LQGSEKGKCPKIDASIGKAEEMAQKSTTMSRTLTSVKDTQAYRGHVCVWKSFKKAILVALKCRHTTKENQ